MSRKNNSYLNNNYLIYTEYYLISSAYHIVNVVNDLLTYSASYSDNFKGYLHSKVVSKQVALNEIICNSGTSSVNNGNNDDVDEDGFVVIKIRKPKTKKSLQLQSHSQSLITCDRDREIIKESHDVVQEVVEKIIQNIEIMNIRNTRWGDIIHE